MPIQCLRLLDSIDVLNCNLVIGPMPPIHFHIVQLWYLVFVRIMYRWHLPMKLHSFWAKQFCCCNHSIQNQNHGFFFKYNVSQIQQTNRMHLHLLFYASFRIDGCLESQNGKYNNARIDCSKRITKWHQQHVAHTIILWRIITAKSNQRSKCQTKWIEYLCRSIQPYHRLK